MTVNPSGMKVTYLKVVENQNWWFTTPLLYLLELEKLSSKIKLNF
jgi:hypothetical protein